MIHGRLRFLTAQIVSDAVAIPLGLLLAYWLRFHSGIDAHPVIAADYLAQFLWAFGLWFFALAATHCYGEGTVLISFNRARRVLRAGALAIVLVITKNYFMLVDDVARSLYPLAFFTVTGLIVGLRFATQALVTNRWLRNPRYRIRTLIIGTGPAAIRLAARCLKRPNHGFSLVGFAVKDPARAGRRLGGVPVYGGFDDVRALIRKCKARLVFVSQGECLPEELERIMAAAELESARVNVIPAPREMSRTPVYYDEMAGIPLFSMRQTPLTGGNLLLKRLMDVVMAFIGVVALAPVLAVLWLLVRREFPGHAIYRQKRVGMDGKVFTCYKFRTMPEGAEQYGPAFGSQLDPRATPLGLFLRRWNLDELPQLWNVLRGDMSLVGPRPERPHFVDQFKEQVPGYMARHSVKAGITGWAQVHGLRGNTSIPMRVRYDLYYIEHWSLWLDIKILVMTFVRFGRRRPAGADQLGVELRPPIAVQKQLPERPGAPIRTREPKTAA